MALPAINQFLTLNAVLFKKVVNNSQIKNGANLEFESVGTTFATSVKVVKSNNHTNTNNVSTKSIRFYTDKNFNGINGDKIVFDDIEYYIDNVEPKYDFQNGNKFHHFEVDASGN